MANTKLRFFILTGDPGIGKTAVTKKLSERLKTKGVKPIGFYTEEVRRDGAREGFDVVTLDGERGKLARDSSTLNVPAGFKVGKYGVLVQEFEKVALPVLKTPDDPETEILVIDEIGKMEFLSGQFKTKINEIFSPKSNCVVLATIPVRKSDPIIESIRCNSAAKVWMITRENRSRIHEEVLSEMSLVLRFQ